MLTTKGTFEKYKTKSEKVIVLDYKKKKIDNPNYQGYKGSKANPNYKGSNYDPNYKKSTWVNYTKKGEKPRNSNYKGKNYIPNYKQKVAKGVFTFNSKKDNVKVKKDTIIEKKHIWVLANELCFGNDNILDNLALLLYIENRVKRQILYYWSKFLGIKNYKSKLKRGRLYLELYLKLRLLKSKRLNKLKKYLGFIENIYKYVLSMSQYALLDKNMKDIFFRYALLINYLISDLNKLKFNNSVNYMSENYRGILFSLKKIYVEYSYSLFGNVKKNIFKSKSISYYLDSLILLFETKRKKDNFLQEKGFKSIGDYYFYNFWTSVSNLYVKHPMSLAELRSRNYKSFRLDDWKAYIASRKEKFNSFKSIFYQKTKKTIRSDQHIFLSKAYPFLKRNMEIKYHRFIYAYTRKLAAAKYVLNIKNILIEYLVDKVSVNAYRIKKNISRYRKDAEEKGSLVTPRRIVKLSERYTYYPRKEYVSKKEKKLRDGFVRDIMKNLIIL